MRLLDNRIYCWLGCGDLLVRNGKKVPKIVMLMVVATNVRQPWSFILGQRDDVWKIRNEALRRRVDLGVAVQLLKLHPMIYSVSILALSQMKWVDVS